MAFAVADVFGGMFYAFPVDVGNEVFAGFPLEDSEKVRLGFVHFAGHRLADCRGCAVERAQ